MSLNPISWFMAHRSGVAFKPLSAESERQISALLVAAQSGQKKPYSQLLTTIAGRSLDRARNDGMTSLQAEHVASMVVFTVDSALRTYDPHQSSERWIEAIIRWRIAQFKSLDPINKIKQK